jgi:hypothetical protein
MRWLGNFFLVLGLVSLLVGLVVRFLYPDLRWFISPSAYLRFTDTCVLLAILFHLKHFTERRAGPAQQPEEISESVAAAPDESST